MQAVKKFESFCIDHDEKWVFVGNLSGQISVIDINSFVEIGKTQAHAGAIMAMASHPKFPYIGCFSQDRTISVFEYDDNGYLRPICAASIRDVYPDNDEGLVDFIISAAQTLAFHDTKKQLVTRSGNGGVVELEFDEIGHISLKHCTRLHGEYDVMTARYVKNSDLVLSGSGDGNVVLSNNGKLEKNWQVDYTNIHWIEHLSGTEYLIASDSRLVARIDISGKKTLLLGPPFALDDFEQVTFNPNSGRVFGASFDRQIYEIDPNTCKPIDVVFKAPFKCRWLKTLHSDPSMLIVISRDGRLCKVNIDSRKCIGLIRETPDALWTGATSDSKNIFFSGEGNKLLHLSFSGVDKFSRKSMFSHSKITLDMPNDSYTKRMDIQNSSGLIVLGRTDGNIFVVDGNSTKFLTNLGSAIRDLTVLDDRPEIFACTENGFGYKIHLETGEKLCTFSSPDRIPLWSLSYNPERNLIAFLQRYGNIFILSAEDFSVYLSGFNAGRTKRAKWVDADRLFFSRGTKIFVVDLKTKQQSVLIPFTSNTIEDFIWDQGHNYLIAISYNCLIGLYDFNSGQLLSEVPDQIDYSKGIMWVPTTPQNETYPLDFFTFGRSGTPHHFRIHNETVIAFGPVVISD